MPPSPWIVSTITAAGWSSPDPQSPSNRSNHRKVRCLSVHVVVEGHWGGVHEWDTGASPFEGVPGHRQGAQRHAVKGVGEGDVRLAPLDLARQLEGGFDGVGSRRTGEHDLVGQFSRAQHKVPEGLQETALGAGGHVKAVGDAVVLHVVEQGALEQRWVVAVVE